MKAPASQEAVPRVLRRFDPREDLSGCHYGKIRMASFVICGIELWSLDSNID